MDKHFPYEMKLVIEQPTVKAAFISDIQPKLETDCPNCGGLGTLMVFLATEGPFQTPAAAYRADGKCSKWNDNKWWVGNTYSFSCPDCGGLGSIPRPKGRTVPIQSEITELARDWTV